MIKRAKKKATFNLDEATHQGLKLAAAVHKREMVELLEEALGAYLGWNKMTKIEQDEMTLYRIAEFDGPGRRMEANFNALSKQLGYEASNEVTAQLLAHLHASGLLIVEVNDGRTGFKNLAFYEEGTKCLYMHGGAIRLQLTIPGRLRYQQLLARSDWEKEHFGSVGAA